ncbi:hypothetical protein RI129_009929 [Pyrocoelia pectoralis]|uniref:Odorant receptor n=1 Tax=Pyrocoelia pectoralis TaxID=417401 RepID=A0AAN7V5P0_9COLE
MAGQETLNYFWKETTVMKMFGVSFTGNESRAYMVYSKLLLVFTILINPFLGLREIYANGIAVYIDYLVYEFAYTMVSIKIVVTYYNRLKLGKIFDKLHKEPFLPNAERGGAVEQKIIDQCTFITRVQILVYWGMAFSTVACTVLYTLYKRIGSSDYHDWVLTYGPLTILDITRSPYYELTLFYQNFTMCCATILFTATDLLIASVLAHISFQFKILQNYLKRLVKDTYLVDFKGESKLEMTEAASKIPWKFLQKSYMKFLSYHLSVIEIAREMEEAFSPLLLLVYLGTIGLLCFEIYRGSMLTNYLQMFRTMGESVSFMVQIGTLSFWGEQVIFESQLVAVAAYETEFVGTDLRFQRALLLTMIRSQRPVKLTAGKFAYIQIFTFTWVVKTSYSAFMILRRAQQ